MRQVTFTLPLKRDGASHVVVASGRAYLFAEYNEAYSFKRLLEDWLGFGSRDDIEVIPLAVVEGPDGLESVTQEQMGASAGG